MSDAYKFLLVRSARKTLVMEIKEDGSLVVRSPRHTDIERIRQFVTANGKWIERKRKSIMARPIPKHKTFTEGEEFLFQGRNYPLHLDETIARIEILNGQLAFPRQWLDKAAVKLIEWYICQAQTYLDERCLHFAGLIGVTIKGCRISNPERRWGSCGTSGKLSFNWRLIMAPQEVFDYVIVHEMTHIKIFNHSPEYWDAVGKVCPNFKQYKAWLKANKFRLLI